MSKDEEYLGTNTSSIDCHKIYYSRALHLLLPFFFTFKLGGVLGSIDTKKTADNTTG